MSKLPLIAVVLASGWCLRGASVPLHAETAASALFDPDASAVATPAPSPARVDGSFNVQCRYQLLSAPASLSLEGITSFEKLSEKIKESDRKIGVWGGEKAGESISPNYLPVGFTGVTGYFRMPGTPGPLTSDNSITRGIDFHITFHDRTDSKVGLSVKVNDNRETPAAADNIFDVDATLAKGTFTLVKLGPPQKDSQAWLAIQADNFDAAAAMPVHPQAEGILSADKRVDFKFTAADGQEIDTTKMRGKVILVDFWATWCGPCVEALPRLRGLYDKFHQDGFEILGINLDQERSVMDVFLKKHPHPWPQSISAPGGKNPLADRFEIKGIPFFLLIDKTGVAEIIEARSPAADDLIAERLKQ